MLPVSDGPSAGGRGAVRGILPAPTTLKPSPAPPAIWPNARCRCRPRFGLTPARTLLALIPCPRFRPAAWPLASLGPAEGLKSLQNSWKVSWAEYGKCTPAQGAVQYLQLGLELDQRYPLVSERAVAACAAGGLLGRRGVFVHHFHGSCVAPNGGREDGGLAERDGAGEEAVLLQHALAAVAQPPRCARTLTRACSPTTCPPAWDTSSCWTLWTGVLVRRLT